MTPEEFRQNIRLGVTTAGNVFAINLVRGVFDKFNLAVATYVPIRDVLVLNTGEVYRLSWIYDDGHPAVDVNQAALDRANAAAQEFLTAAQERKARAQERVDRSNTANPRP